MYPVKFFKNCYREASRFGHRKGNLRQIILFMRKCLPKETPNRLRRLLSIFVVVSCMPVAIIIACVHVVWTFAKTRFFLFQLREYDIVTYNQRTDESENLYEAVFVADGWIDRKQLISRFSLKASHLLTCSRYRKGGIEIWYQHKKASLEEHILEKSSLWKHRRVSLSTAYDCASSFLQEPLPAISPPWRITIQYLQDCGTQTLLTVKCDKVLQEAICDVLIDNYRKYESRSAFCNTVFVVKNIVEVVIDVAVAVKNFLLHHVKLLRDFKFFTSFVHLFETSVLFCAIFWSLMSLLVKWLFGTRPDFVECDCWKELVLCVEELRSAVRIITQLPSEFLKFLELRVMRIRAAAQLSKSEYKQLRRCISEQEERLCLPVLSRSHSTSFEDTQAEFMWTQPLQEDVLWRLCEVSGTKRSALLTSICVSELKRATFDLGPAYSSSNISFQFENDDDVLVLESGIRTLLDPEVVDKELSRLREKRKEEMIKREMSGIFRKLFPKHLWSWRNELKADMTFRFNAALENSQIMDNDVLIYADVTEGSHKVLFSVHRARTHTVITCSGLPNAQLRFLVIGIERKIYAMASQFGVQTKRLSPYSSPQSSASSTPLHKSYLSNSTSSIQELEGE